MIKLTARIVLFLSFIAATQVLSAQDFSTPDGYLSHFSKTLEVMNQTYMNYLSAVAHGKRARKVEKLRLKTLDGILLAKGEVAGAPGFKGDKTYRNAVADYVKTCYLVFNEDYHKIVDMEEVAEQSYDAMEAYLLAQQKAGEKLKEASKKQADAQRAFAAANNIKLIDNKDELDVKMETANKVNEYFNKLYLVFFKSYRQDLYLTDAINKGDLNAMEQSRNALETYSSEGLAKLDAIGSYASDATALKACEASLKFYKQLATKNMEPVSNFMLVSDNFSKLKKTFEATPAAKRTQADVDGYNKAVTTINKASAGYNKSNADINHQRTEMLDNWNRSVKDFFDTQMPYAK